MATKDSSEQNPLWVRLAVGKGNKRPAVISSLIGAGMLAGLALFSVVSEFGNLGWLALSVGLAGAAGAILATVWIWLAVRWADRNRACHQTPDGTGTPPSL